MVTFNEAMLSNDRALAIRVGDFTSENIKSANFKYGYITGDDFTPGGTYAGTASILFTSIVESFKKLDVVYPEIGLLVGSKVEWVKMGKYYIDNIKIDRNANTTEIELMDEMFKLNESFKTDLKYPAQIRDVILEIATKTGVTLASDDFGTTAIQQHVDEPTGDKLTYRDVLSQASQLLGFSCFFNRNGELEVRGLTESGITITADNYFLHGLEKSEVEYQIAGITCEVANNKKLTVGLQTGRSLEIENPLATQDTLNLLYYALKDIVYYPYDLSYQGHLKLDVGQWVTIKTNKDEVFKVPVLYQSFSFSGGLTSTISADSVAGSDAQYTYGSFVTKKIEQKSTQIQAEVQQQLKYADEEFKKVSNEMLQQSLEYQNSVRNELATSKAELETQIDTAKTQAETNAKAYADEINQATAEVAEQANTAVNSLKSDLAKVKTDLTATTSTANDAKTSASEAKQQLTTVANDLSKAKQDLTSQAQQLQAQASAQSELTKRVSTVEETANGTKTTVSELSKTVDSNTKNITSVTARTKTVEDDLLNTKTTLSQVKTTADNTNQKTATLETGLNGVKADLAATTVTADTTKTNLANYQASNDKLAANLQSNLQTTNGNVSSLKTKIEAVPGQISSAISTVEGKLEAIDQLNLIGAFNLTPQDATFDKTDYTLTSTTTTNTKDGFLQLQFFDAKNVVFTGFGLAEKVGKFAKSFKITKAYERFRIKINGNASDASVWCYDKDLIKLNTDYVLSGEVLSLSADGKGNGGKIRYLKIQEGKVATGFSKSPKDVDSDISKVTSEFKQTTDSIKASVSSLDKSTVKSASLTINADGIVMKAGKSTTDVANAIGSYFAVNQNAINLFSDKINVKGSMIVDGAITSTKIASKSINTAHLNGKIITADVISAGAITANAIKAGAVTTSAMSANSINGDRITAGTLDAAKIKAGSITASQIASGTITSSQIKAGGISAANIAAGAITTNHLATGSITADKIKAGSITSDMFRGNKITSLNNATTLNLQTGEITFNNIYATINQTKGSYKSQISLFSLDDKASTESSWSSVNALAFNSTNLTSATRRVGLTTNMFPKISEMTLYGKRIAFTGETSVALGPDNAIIITTNSAEVDFINGLTNNSKGAWNYSMIMNFGTKAVINVPDIKLDGHIKSLTGILDDLCKKVGLMWV
ncbi:hypothetical protein [Streptococcus gallolyticus]|uniref:hypothetical protein n=1 Tax=Streptococcus gallolyticus TaxID=315405 RepID=UPI0020B117A2|nr:hypothetical protein [Streptococcus gallolyticus]